MVAHITLIEVGAHPAWSQSGKDTFSAGQLERFPGRSDQGPSGTEVEPRIREWKGGDR